MSIDSVGLGLPDGMAGWRMVKTRKPADFTALTRDPAMKRDIAYLREKLPAKDTAAAMLADPRLQRIVLQAFGLDSQIGMSGLMKKVLDSDTSNPSSVAARMNDPRYLDLSRTLNYGGVKIPEIPALPSSARVEIMGMGGDNGLASFSGRFGSVTVQDVPLGRATTRADVAATLQAAFQRADGGRSDITVTVSASELVFKDAKGRGGAKGFDFEVTGSATAEQTESTDGQPVTPARGGPAVANAATADTIVRRYMQSRFEAAVGTNSDTLRAALYAQRTLPQVSSWYSVLADQNLGRVVRGALGLPDGMVKVDVDRQVNMLKSRMDIKDFKDPAKLGAMLDRFVARSAASADAGTTTAAGAALALFQS